MSTPYIGNRSDCIAVIDRLIDIAAEQKDSLVLLLLLEAIKDAVEREIV
jgi:hypothetical protein